MKAISASFSRGGNRRRDCNLVTDDFLSFIRIPLLSRRASRGNIVRGGRGGPERLHEGGRSRSNFDIPLLIISSISIRARTESSRFRGGITSGEKRERGGASCNERTKASAASNVGNYSILPIKSGAGSTLVRASSTRSSLLFDGREGGRESGREREGASNTLIVTNVGTTFRHYARSCLGDISRLIYR